MENILLLLLPVLFLLIIGGIILSDVTDSYAVNRTREYPANHPSRKDLP